MRSLQELVSELRRAELGGDGFPTGLERDEAKLIADTIENAGVGGEHLIAAELTALREAIEAATAPPAVDVRPEEMPLAGWAYVELMGRRVLVGYVQEAEIAHRTMLRIQRLAKADRPRGLGEPDPPLELENRERLYSPSTLYSIEWITEAEARERWLAMHGQVRDYADDDIPF